mmetsp:Transcript_8985/g.11322  ORF Transcript_8985/g.11322 Transcript_8985/m.11322 type:complete len:181 (-) Transcript_8985:439-981(-)
MRRKKKAQIIIRIVIRQIFKNTEKMTTELSIAEACLDAKKASGKTYDELAEICGVTNVYLAQILLGQAQLKPATKAKLSAAMPTLSEEIMDKMANCPTRCFDSDILKEPQVYRTYEAVMHYGLAIKNIVNEKFGDGIMSAIDYYMSVKEIKGVKGERRVVITLNGKFLPFIQMNADEDTS